MYEGKHTLEFTVKQSPLVESLSVYKCLNVRNPNLGDILPSIEDGNRRPILKLLCLDQGLTALLVKASVLPGSGHLLFRRDDDDLKLVINGTPVTNNLPKAHSDWYWCGQAQKYQPSQELTLEKPLDFAYRYLIELYGDRTPKIRSFILSFAPRLLSTTFDETKFFDDIVFTTNTLTRKEIEDLLKDYGKTNPNHIANRKFNGKEVAELIFEACAEYEVNPKVVISKFQSEYGLIYGKASENPSEEALNTALGVGALDSGLILQEYQGFAKQVVSAVYFLRWHFDLAPKNDFSAVVDERKMKVGNRSTYSLYRYTPHVEGARRFLAVYKDLFDNQW